MAQTQTISGDELRARIKRLGLTYAQAADRLGLTLDGLNKQMRGTRRVSRQSAIILDLIEELRRLASARRQGELPFGERERRPEQRLAQYLYPTVPRRK
jgi:hypothetical protein